MPNEPKRLMATETSPARELVHARILPKADESQEGADRVDEEVDATWVKFVFSAPSISSSHKIWSFGRDILQPPARVNYPEECRGKVGK